MSSAISQLSSFSSMVSSRRLQLHTRRYNLSSKKVLHVLNSDEHGTKASHLDNKPGPSYVEDASTSHNGSSVKSHTVAEGFGLGGETNGHRENKVVNQSERTAKIHDFCLGIPFGGLVLIGALFSFILSRNTVTLSGGVLYGGALLALSTSSLKVWRKGKSTLPFILGQAAFSVALLRKDFQAYALTKRLFPTGFNVVISAAMLCFYAYVVLSGGNPPPKKSKPSTAVGSS